MWAADPPWENITDKNKTKITILHLPPTAIKMIFFPIIMRIHITTNKYTVYKIWKMINEKWKINKNILTYII